MSAEGASASIPSSARVVVIGGGVIGCSTAYHLARRGWTDVVLLERHKLTSGTTWHAAGLVVTSGFTTSTGMEIAKYTRDLYATLEQETGFATGFDPVGLLQIAANPEILEDLQRKATFGRSMGIETHELSPSEVAERWPSVRAPGSDTTEADVPVTRDFISSGDWEIEIAGQRHEARASLRPLYDPKGERVRS